jgi:hypothetical protein
MAGSDKLLHHDPVAVNIVQLELDRCRSLGPPHSGSLDRSQDFTLVAKRRFIRPASFYGLSEKRQFGPRRQF